MLLNSRRIAKKVAKTLLAKLGYNITSISSKVPAVLLSFNGHPKALRYLSTSGRTLITGKVEDGRSLFVFPLDDKNRHPFVRAVQSAIDVSLVDGNEREAIKRSLKGFYSLYQPVSAAEVLGASSQEIPMLGNQPPWVVIKPWENVSVTDRVETISKTEKLDNKQVSNFSISIEHGCNYCGPVTDNKLEIEVERLYRVLRSIRTRGFVRHGYYDGDIRADVLVDNSGNWKWVVKSGQHRVAVLSALGYRDIPIRIESVVCRDEVDYWPKVLNGEVSHSAALKIFDNMFFGVGLLCNSSCRENPRASLIKEFPLIPPRLLIFN